MFIHRSGREWVCGVKRVAMFSWFSCQNPFPPPTQWAYFTVLIPSVSSHMFPNMVSLWKHNLNQFHFMQNKLCFFILNEQHKKSTTSSSSCRITTEFKNVSNVIWGPFVVHQHLEDRKSLSWYNYSINDAACSMWGLYASLNMQIRSSWERNQNLRQRNKMLSEVCCCFSLRTQRFSFFEYNNSINMFMWGDRSYRFVRK